MLRSSNWIKFDAQRMKTKALVRAWSQVRNTCWSHSRVTGMEEATKKGQVQEFFDKKTPKTSRTTHGRMGQRL